MENKKKIAFFSKKSIVKDNYIEDITITKFDNMEKFKNILLNNKETYKLYIIDIDTINIDFNNIFELIKNKKRNILFLAKNIKLKTENKNFISEKFSFLKKPYTLEELKIKILNKINIINKIEKYESLKQEYETIFQNTTDAIFLIDDDEILPLAMDELNLNKNKDLR